MQPLVQPRKQKQRASRVGWIVLVLLGGVLITGIGTSVYVSASWDIMRAPPPWGERPSIFEHVKRHLPDDQEAPLEAGGDTLPDSDAISGRGGMHWASGALDGLWGAETHSIEIDDFRARFDEALRGVMLQHTPARMTQLYDLLLEYRAVSYVDELIEELNLREDMDKDRLGAVGRWLLTRAPDREAVKVGQSLLGIAAEPEDRALFMTVGRHDEFTLFSAVALENSFSNPEPSLWELARGAHGWGRIQAVWRLAGTSKTHIRAWLLREGFRNSVMNEYLAYTCATSGKLDEALAGPSVDDELIRGAGEILEALINGGPAESIDDYEYGAIAVGHYLRHVEVRDVDVEELLTVETLRRFLAGGSAELWLRRQELGWDTEWRIELLGRCERFIERRAWVNRVRELLAEAQGKRFLLACRAAEVVGIDPWGYQLRRLERGEDLWFWVMQTPDRRRAERVIALALERLPLERIATGASDAAGVGPAFEHHNALGAVLQELGRFPGKGWPLVEAGLESPVVRNRNQAIGVLEAWGRRHWPAGAAAALEQALKVEPDEVLRAWLEQVLAER